MSIKLKAFDFLPRPDELHLAVLFVLAVVEPERTRLVVQLGFRVTPAIKNVAKDMTGRKGWSDDEWRFGRIYSFYPEGSLTSIKDYNPHYNPHPSSFYPEGRHAPDLGEKEGVGGLHEAWQGTSEHINWDLDHKKIITSSVKAISAN